MANRVTDKITPLTDSIYICRSGSAADTQNLSRYVQVRLALDLWPNHVAGISGYARVVSCSLTTSSAGLLRCCAQWFLEQHGLELKDQPNVKTAATLAQSMAYQNKNFLQARLTGHTHDPTACPRAAQLLHRGLVCRPVQAGLIVAGWDNQEGGSVYAIPLGGTLVKTPFSIGGSGSAYINGLCDKLWRVRVHARHAHIGCRNASNPGATRGCRLACPRLACSPA